MPTTPLLDIDGQPLFSVQLQAILEGLDGNGVAGQSDLAVTAGSGDNETSIAPGTAEYNDTEATLGSTTTKTHSDGPSGNDVRWDLLAFDTSANSVVLREGTATAPSNGPTPPGLQSDEVLLALVYIETGQTNFGSDAVLDSRVPTAQGGVATSVSDDGTTVVAEPTDINFDDNLDVTDDGDGTVSVTGTASASVSDDGTTAVSEPTDINFADYLSVIDDGDETASVTIPTEKTAPENTLSTLWNVPVTSAASDGDTIGFKFSINGQLHLGIQTETDGSGNIGTGGNGGVVADVPLRVNDTAQLGEIATGGDITAGNQSNIIYDFSKNEVPRDVVDLNKSRALTNGDTVTVSDASQHLLAAQSIDAGQICFVDNATLTGPLGQPVSSGIDLELVTLDNSGGFTSQTTIHSGDGSAVYDRPPLGSFYENTSGFEQTVGILVDNQSGSSEEVHASVHAEVRDGSGGGGGGL